MLITSLLRCGLGLNIEPPAYRTNNKNTIFCKSELWIWNQKTFNLTSWSGWGRPGWRTCSRRTCCTAGSPGPSRPPGSGNPGQTWCAPSWTRHLQSPVLSPGVQNGIQLDCKGRLLCSALLDQVVIPAKEYNALFRQISNSAQCGRFALILWRLERGLSFVFTRSDCHLRI